MVRRLVSDGRRPSGPCTEPASARIPETRREGRSRGPGSRAAGHFVKVLSTK
ncbi:Hypothetical predicted protein, partial [Marmota monax]